MENDFSTKLMIDDISQINIHHQYNTNCPVYSIIQLDSGVIAIGLCNGSILFFKSNNLEEPYLCFKVDEFPIYSLLQMDDDELICNSGQYLYFIYDSKVKNNFDKKEKIICENIYGNINKILLMYDKSIIIGDDKYISLFHKEKKKLKLIKHMKVNAPIMNLNLIRTNLLLAVVPSLQKIIFCDPEKLVNTYEIKNIKFYKGIKYSNIICRISKDLIAIGGCMGSIYFVNLKNKQLIANISIGYKNEIITCIYLMQNGDMVCGSSMILKDSNTQQEYICPNLVQFRYETLVFKEIKRKKNVHEDVVGKIIEIVNHKGINEFATISLDGYLKVWD